MALIPVTHNISESVLDLGKKFPVNTWLIFNTLIADDFNCVVFKCLQIITPSQPPVRFCSDWCVHYCHLTSVGPLANFTVHGPPASGTQWGGGGDEVTQLSARPTQHRFCSFCQQNAAHMGRLSGNPLHGDRTALAPCVGAHGEGSIM